MEAHYFEEVEKYINSFKLQVEDEKKEIAECQKKFSTLLNAFSQKAPSNSVLNSLFKDDEPEGFVFSKYEEKRKQLAEQRRAEYNAYLEKKEAERRAKQRTSQEKNDVRPKSILDSVDYESILAKRKEEEAKFRNINIADILHNSSPVRNETTNKLDLNRVNSSNHAPSVFRNNSIPSPAAELPGTVTGAQQRLLEERRALEALEKENARLLEERIAKQLEEQRIQMHLQFEQELRKNNQMKEEIESLKSSNSVKSMPQRIEEKIELPKLGKTGGGGEPVRDSYGNLLAMRGSNKVSTSDFGIMSFPSMQQQPIKDRMTLYREELQKQIEEKRRLEALEKEKLREQEERIAKRIEEQRLKILAEYEREAKKTDKVKEEFLRQQERIRQLEEFQRKDAEARRKRIPVAKTPDPPKTPPVIERSTSPPIPAVRTKVLLEKAVPPNSVTPELKQENPMSTLAEIRRRIMEEQQKTNKEKSYKVMNRRTVQEVSDDEDDDIFKSSTNSYNMYSS